MSDFLGTMAGASAKRITRARQITPDREIRDAAESAPPPREFPFGVRAAVIAEIKRAAPSVGTLQGKCDVAARAAAYEKAGAAAISVLTEPTKFLGSLQDLRDVRSATDLPVMRKDFLVEPYQLYEARANGADGVLLIAAMLDDHALNEMLQVADYLGIFALVEAFSELDAERAQAAGAQIIGINCRNLRDLSVEFERFEQLRGFIDRDRTAVAESGITNHEHLSRVLDLDYDAALIGSALMRENDPAAALAAMCSSTRECAR